MKLALTLALFLTLPTSISRADEAEKDFTPIFDGKSFEGWKVAEHPAAFRIEDGAIVANGERAHAFYTGPLRGAKFSRFELRMDVMTRPKSNGGIFIHSDFQESGWPAKGYEIQVNNTQSDWKKSGGVYGFQDNKTPFEDDMWMRYIIRVDTGKITVTINGRLVSDFTPKEGESRLTPEGGAIALQAHDPASTVFYKNIRIRPLD